MCVLLTLAGMEKFIKPKMYFAWVVFLRVPITCTYFFPQKHLFILHATLLNRTKKVVRKEGDDYCTGRQNLSSLSTTVPFRTILTQMIIIILPIYEMTPGFNPFR